MAEIDKISLASLDELSYSQEAFTAATEWIYLLRTATELIEQSKYVLKLDTSLL